nr:hypothetical protein [uncultured bacterium]
MVRKMFDWFALSFLSFNLLFQIPFRIERLRLQYFKEFNFVNHFIGFASLIIFVFFSFTIHRDNSRLGIERSWSYAAAFGAAFSIAVSNKFLAKRLLEKSIDK